MLKSLLKFNFKLINEFGITEPNESFSENHIIKWCKFYVKDSQKYINISFTRIYIEKSTIIFEFSHTKNYKDFDLVSEYLLNLNFEEDFIIDAPKEALKMQSSLDEPIGSLKMILFK